MTGPGNGWILLRLPDLLHSIERLTPVSASNHQSVATGYADVTWLVECSASNDLGGDKSLSLFGKDTS